MSNTRIGAIAFGLGVVAGLFLHDQLDKPSELKVQQALADLSRARDSLLMLTPTIVRTTDTVPGQPIVRVIRERYVDTIVIDSFPNRQLLIPVRVVDTVWVGGGDGFAWDFAEHTTAYGLRGTCYANLVDPSSSYTTYTLDVHERTIQATRWRVWGEIGIHAQRPFIGASVRLTDRVMVGPMVGTTHDEEWYKLTWGMKTSIGLF